MNTNPHADSVTTSAAQTAQPTGTIQARIPNDAVITDVRRVLEDNRELASITYRQEPFYPTRVKTELRDRFGWDVDTDTIRAAVNQLGPDVVKACAHPHPNGR